MFENYTQEPIKRILDAPLVRIPSLGWVKGRTYTETDRPYYGFLGVKYAESPSGTNRFKVNADFHCALNSPLI